MSDDTPADNDYPLTAAYLRGYSDAKAKHAPPPGVLLTLLACVREVIHEEGRTPATAAALAWLKAQQEKATNG